jgi:cell division protein FtsA
MSGLRLEVEADVVLAKSTIVNNLIKTVNNSGLEVKGIVLEPLAVSEASLRKDEVKLGAAIVDVGAEKIDISVFKNSNIVYTDTIAYGGNTITNDISVCLKVPFTESEKLKIKYGSLEILSNNNVEPIKIKSNYNDVINIDYHVLNEIIEARAEELLTIVKDKLIESKLYDEITGIVIVGGGLSLFKGVSTLGRRVFNKPVRIGSPEFVGASSPIYNTVVGIIKDAVNTGNFSNHDENKKSSNDIKKSTIREEAFDQELGSQETSIFSKIKGFLADFF